MVAGVGSATVAGLVCLGGGLVIGVVIGVGIAGIARPGRRGTVGRWLWHRARAVHHARRGQPLHRQRQGQQADDQQAQE
jgi:hypothetical protein